jgi:trans-aconitate methyltransferase
MLAAARARGLTVDQADLTSLPYDAEFDAVFSNAALHWIPCANQPALLAGIHRALRPGGRFVAEMGGLGNIAAIRTALSAVLAGYGLDAEDLAASFYPSSAHYGSLLETAGFTVESMEIVPRPTPLPNGADAMAHWLETFRNGVLDLIPDPARRQEAIAATIALLRPILQDAHTLHWTGDYVRLRFRAIRA